MIRLFPKIRFLIFVLTLFNVSSGFAMQKLIIDIGAKMAIATFRNAAVPAIATAYIAKKDLKKEFPSYEITEDKKNKQLTVSTVLYNGIKASQLIIFDKKGHWTLPNNVTVSNGGSATMELLYNVDLNISPDSADIKTGSNEATQDFKRIKEIGKGGSLLTGGNHNVIGEIENQNVAAAKLQAVLGFYVPAGYIINARVIGSSLLDPNGRFECEFNLGKKGCKKWFMERFLKQWQKDHPINLKESDIKNILFRNNMIWPVYTDDFLRRREAEKETSVKLKNQQTLTKAGEELALGITALAPKQTATSKKKAEDKLAATLFDGINVSSSGSGEPPTEDPDDEDNDKDREDKKPSKPSKWPEFTRELLKKLKSGDNDTIKIIEGDAEDAFECFKKQVESWWKDKDKPEVLHGYNKNKVRFSFNRTSYMKEKGPTIYINESEIIDKTLKLGIRKIKFLATTALGLMLEESAAQSFESSPGQRATIEEEKHTEMDTSSHNGQETKTAASSSNNSQGFSGKTQQTKARAPGKTSPTVPPSSMDQSADGKKGLGLKKKPQPKNGRSGGPMCGGDGKVTQPLKKLKHRMSFKQVGRIAPNQLEEDEDPNLSDDETGLGLTSQRSSRPGASMSTGNGNGTQSLTTLEMQMPSKQLGLIAPPKSQKDAPMPQKKPSRDRTYVPSYRTPQDELYRVAERILKKPEHKRTQMDQQFMGYHPDIIKEVASWPGISDPSRSDDKLGDTKSPRGHQQSNPQAMEGSDGEEGDGEVYDEHAIAQEIQRIQNILYFRRTDDEKQFLINHKDVVEKLELEKNRRLEAEVNAHRKAKDDLFDAKVGIDNLERIHRIPAEKRSARDAAKYNRLAPHISSFIKTFDKKLKKELKAALKKSPKERNEDEKTLIENHPEKIKEIQDEAKQEEKLLKKKEKAYAKVTKKSMHAAALTRLMKYFDEQEAYYKDKIDTIREVMLDNKLLGIESQELHKLYCKDRETNDEKRTFFASRRGAIRQTLDNPNTSRPCEYPINNIPPVYAHIINVFTEFRGSPAQEQVHDELYDIIKKTNALYNEQYQDPYEVNKNIHVANIAAFLYHFADIARQYNETDKIEQAFALADFCSDLVDVENAYVAFVTQHESRVMATLWSALFDTVKANAEFGKKFNGFIKEYDTKEITAAINKAAASLSKALQLTYDDSNDFDEKILADGPALIQALTQGGVAARKALITFALNRFCYGSALGLRPSQDIKKAHAKLLLKIAIEHAIAAQADTNENREMLSPILTIFRQAIENALEAAQERLDQKESDSEESEPDVLAMSGDEASETKKPANKPAQTKGKTTGASNASSSSNSSNRGTKRTLTHTKETKKPAAKTGTEDKQGVASMDEAGDRKNPTNPDDSERLKKRVRYKKQLSDGKEAKKPGDTHDIKIPILFCRDAITQFQSIDQNNYENDPLLNLFGGNLMCGHFSAFNGSCMLDIVNDRRNRERAEQDMLCKKAFNTWLGERREIIESYEHDAVGNIFGNHIERLLEASGDKFYTDNTSVVEIENIHNSFIQRDGQVPLFLPADNALVEQIHYFRASKAPQLVILNTGFHWICMVFGQDWIWIADSLNPDLNEEDQATQTAVSLIRDLFTTQPIPAVAELEQLRNQYRDVPKSAAARDEEKRAQPKPLPKQLLKSILKNRKSRNSKK